MINYRGISTNNSITDWQEMKKTIRAAVAEYNQYSFMMTPYERSTIEREIEAKRKQSEPAIMAAVLGIWNEAVDNLKNNDAAVIQARKREVAQWDAGRLGNEMQVYQMRLDQTLLANQGSGHMERGTVKTLQRMYQEAQDCGDKYKARACAEVMRGVLARTSGYDLEERFPINELAERAGRDLEAMSETPELKAAQEAANRSVDGLNAARREILDAADALGYTAPNGNLMESRLIDALARVKQNDDGTFQIDERK